MTVLVRTDVVTAHAAQVCTRLSRLEWRCDCCTHLCHVCVLVAACLAAGRQDGASKLQRQRGVHCVMPDAYA